MKYELIRPRSAQNPDYEQFEYVIRWIGRDGAEYLYLFYDAEIQRRTSGELINEESEELIETLISRERKTVMLKADDLSKIDLDVILQMFGNKFVTRLKKDGSFERYAVDVNSYKYRLTDGRYEIEFALISSNLKVWN